MDKLLKLIRVYDNGGKTLDRFTVVYMFAPEKSPNTFTAFGMSERPFAPLGFGQHCIAMPGKHLGKRISFKQLPIDCQQAVIKDLSE